MQTLKDQACIVGVGESAYTRGSGTSVLRLVLEASRHAIADAGLTTSDLNGFVLPSSYIHQEALAANLGISDLRYSTVVQMGGASPVTALQSAAITVTMGISTHVLVPFGWNGYSETRVSRRERPEALTRPPDNAMSQAVRNYYAPYGAMAPMQYYAWLATRHRELYGTTDDYHGAFYQFCKQHELRFQRCQECHTWRHMPRESCASCGALAWSWERSSGKGQVFSWTIVHRALHPGFNDDLPYAVVVVELDEGVRLVSHVVDLPPNQLRLGLPVEVVFDDVTPEVTLPKFRPLSA